MNDTPVITSPANETVKRLKSLAVKKYREEEGLFLVEGARHIADALRGGMSLAILAFSERGQADAAAFAAPRTLAVTDDILRRITGRDNPQAVIAAFEIPAPALAAVQGGLWVGLESVRDPGNLGTIVRTADAAGADGLILIGACCDPFQPETIRATVGSFARIPVVRTDTPAFLQWRAGWPGRVIGTHLDENAADYRTIKYDAPLLLLMGNESAGLSAPLAAACDTRARIPMQGGTESLNLAVSTALMLYEIRRGAL